MTIIEPNKRKKNISLLIIPILLIIFGGAFFSISFYNDTVDLKHQFSDFEDELHKMEVVNAELKNKLYSLLDIENMKELINDKGLVLDKNPKYLEFKNDELATTLRVNSQ